MIMITRVLLAAVLFYVVSNPATYKLVESLLGRFFKIAMNGSPTPLGLWSTRQSLPLFSISLRPWCRV